MEDNLLLEIKDGYAGSIERHSGLLTLGFEFVVDGGAHISGRQFLFFEVGVRERTMERVKDRLKSRIPLQKWRAEKKEATIKARTEESWGVNRLNVVGKGVWKGCGIWERLGSGLRGLEKTNRC